MSRGEVIFPAVVFAVVAVLIAGGFVAGYSWTVITFPLGAAIIVCGLSALQVSWAVAGKADRAAAEDEPLAPLTVASLAWLFALGLFIAALGFVFGPAAYLLAYLRAHDSSWTLSGVIAAASILVTWGLFIVFLKVPLPLEPFWMG